MDSFPMLKKGIQPLFPLHPTPSYFCFFAVLAPLQHGMRHTANCGSGDRNLPAPQPICSLAASQETVPAHGELLLSQMLTRNCPINEEGEASLGIRSKYYC